MKIEKFEDVESWKKARDLVKELYQITGYADFRNDYALTDQVRRAAISIMANIAEGFDSGSDKIFINFLNYSFRSASEVQSLLYIATDLKYIDESKFTHLYEELTTVKKLIGGLIKYLRNSTHTKTKD